MLSRLSVVIALAASQFAAAHTVITYPGWRGDNLHSNGSVTASSIGIDYTNGTAPDFPYGMQWMYPCGGMPQDLNNNRTLWPVGGGGLAFQPGWFSGHQNALIYVNLGLGTIPPNMSHVMIPPFQIIGPDNEKYNGSVCLPQIPLPVNITVNVGDNATIQLIETAQHGAALYNCVDITFANPQDVPELNSSNCYNSSDISFASVFETTSLSAADSHFLSRAVSFATFVPLFAAVVLGAW